MKNLLKWAGGKAWLRDNYSHLLPVPENGGKFIEPFIGGGSIAGYALGKYKCLLSDKNWRLIAMYRGVRDNPEVVFELLMQLKYDESMYYSVRASFNKLSAPDEQTAAWFIYLNRTGYNGLYRENHSGGFNVPWGTYKNPTICDAESIMAWSYLLRGSAIHESGFVVALEQVQSGDAVYLDPPFVPKNKGGFTTYQAGGFGPAEQELLASYLEPLDRIGAKWLLSNHSEARDLYKGWHIREVEVSRSINSKGRGRGAVTEILVANYDIGG